MRMSEIVAENAAEDEVESVWMQAVGREWYEELADTREDIYTLEDGEPLQTAR